MDFLKNTVYNDKNITTRTTILFPAWEDTISTVTRTLCIFVFMFLFILNAAATTLDYDYSRIEKIILDAPESAGVSMESLVQYIRDHAQGDEEKAYAVYLWLITNVAYDYEMKDKIVYGGMNIWTEHKGLDFWVDGAFENRKAICGSFSYIYLRIAQELGLTVASIPGWMTNFKSEGAASTLPLGIQGTGQPPLERGQTAGPVALRRLRHTDLVPHPRRDDSNAFPDKPFLAINGQAGPSPTRHGRPDHLPGR
jgi:hypothetical protein